MNSQTSLQSPHRGLSPESDLILTALSGGDRDGRLDRLRELMSGQLDWDYIARACDHHGVTPQLRDAINEAGADLVPEEVTRVTEQFCRHMALRNLMLVRELLDLIQRFAEHGIETLAFKGPLLAEMYYGGLSNRLFWDLDILIRKERVLEAKRLILERGYQPEFQMTKDEERQYLERDCEYNFDREDGQIHLEVHWHIMPRHSVGDLDVNLLWERSEEKTLAGQTVRTFGAEEFLVYLCAHGGGKHAWQRLRMILDIRRLIEEEPDFDWDRAIETARITRQRRQLAEGLYMAERMLGTKLPDPAGEFVAQYPDAATRSALARGRMFRDGHGLPGYKEWRHYLAAMEGGSHLARGFRPDLMTRYGAAILKPEFLDRAELPPLPAGMAFLHSLARMRRIYARKRGEVFERFR